MFSGWLYIAVEWLAPLAAMPFVVRHHRRPFIAIAWLGCIFAFPPLGIPLFFLFSVFGAARRREAELAARRAYASMPGALAQGDEGVELSECMAEISRVAERMGETSSSDLRLVAGNGVSLLSDGAMIEKLCEDIDTARYHVHLQYFIFAPDETGNRVADRLASAAARGVKCRLLVDAYGSREFLKKRAPDLRRRGVEVLEMLSMRAFTRIRRFDIRNHRKNAIVDGHIAYTGSNNIHNADFELEHGTWHQLSARVAGPSVQALQAIFLEDWSLSSGRILHDSDLFPTIGPQGDVPVQLIADGPTYPDRRTQHIYIQAIGSARKSILLTTPYFLPDEPLIVALCTAALRGVEVCVLLPEQSDRPVADVASRASWETLLRAGVQLMLHDDGVIHIKSAVIDDEAVLIGTANLDRRSFFLNYEMTLFIPDRRTAAELTRRLDAYVVKCRQVALEGWMQRTSLERWREDFAKLLSPLL